MRVLLCKEASGQEEQDKKPGDQAGTEMDMELGTGAICDPRTQGLNTGRLTLV